LSNRVNLICRGGVKIDKISFDLRKTIRPDNYLEELCVRRVGFSSHLYLQEFTAAVILHRLE